MVWSTDPSKPSQTLRKTLTIRKTCDDPKAAMPNFPYPQFMYDGQVLPPALKVRPTDTIALTVVNGETATPFPFTNIHYHGLNVPPGPLTEPYGDSVFIEIKPGKSGKYSIPIPEQQGLGTYWYHPHPHGTTEAQVLGGLSGPIVMDGLIETYYQKLQPLKTTKDFERFLLLKDYVPVGSKSPIGPNCAVKTVNGVAPTASKPGKLTVPPSTPQLLHVANIGADQYFDLQICDGDCGGANGAQKMFVLAVDGNPTFCVDAAGNKSACPVPMTDLFLPPGSRMDVLISLPALAGNKPYGLWTKAVDTGTQGDRNCRQQLGWIVVSGSPTGTYDLGALKSTSGRIDRMSPTELQTKLKNQSKVCTGGTAAQSSSDGSIVIPFTEGTTPTNKPWFSILPNSTTYKEHRLDMTVALPCVAEWKLQNTSSEAHVFHIHQVDFVVENDSNAIDSTPPAEPVIYRDTVNVPSGKTVNILIDFTDTSIAGNFVYHCHILNHEDLGMMANICAATDVSTCKPPEESPSMSSHSHP
jgi:FtsP/CotA-like multicopper oxidase with cupredoxin domain